MSGRSGYGRSKIVGKLINLPANMMMAGLAPKVGKPGWAIRLYWHRVDCCYGDSCRAEPIKILKRYLTPGKWPGLDSGWAGTNSYTFGYAPASDITLTTGMVIADYLVGGTVGPESMPYYIILFDKEILSNNSTAPPAGLNLYRCDPAGTSATSLITTIPATDFYYTIQGGISAIGLGTKEYTEVVTPLAISSWNIDISGSFIDGDVGGGQWHNINNEAALSNLPGWPVIGGWVNRKYSKNSANTVFIVHKNVPTYFPGNPTAKAAMIFNISQLLVHSFQNNDTALTSIDFGSNPATPCQQLMILENFNSISTTYFGSSVGTGVPLHINIADECQGIKAQAAIAPFTISSITGLPALEQLPL